MELQMDVQNARNRNVIEMFSDSDWSDAGDMKSTSSCDPQHQPKPEVHIFEFNRGRMVCSILSNM